MNAYSSKSTGAGNCQISSVAQRRACRNKAAARRWTGKRWVTLCRKCDARHGQAIGSLKEPSPLTGSDCLSFRSFTEGEINQIAANIHSGE